MPRCWEAKETDEPAAQVVNRGLNRAAMRWAETTAASLNKSWLGCYAPEPVSGNPRGNDFLRAIWREEEKWTQAAREREAQYLAVRKELKRRAEDRAAWLAANGPAPSIIPAHVHCGKCGGVARFLDVTNEWACTLCLALAHREGHRLEWMGGIHP